MACSVVTAQAQTTTTTTKVKTIVGTKFDKNDPDIFKAKAFVEKVDEIWQLVREEAIKAQGKRA